MVKANIYLALLVLIYSFYIADSCLDTIGVFARIPHLTWLFIALTFTFGPLHYLYARAIVTPNFKFSKEKWLHFLPFILVRLFYLAFYFKSPDELLDAIIYLKKTGEPIYFTILSFGVVVHGLIYMALTLLLLKNYANNIKNIFSATDKHTLNWLRNMTQLAIVVWLIALAVNVLQQFGHPQILATISFIAMATSLYVYIIGYLGLRQQEIFSSATLTTSHAGHLNTIEQNKTEKYSKSGLSVDIAKHYLTDLLNLMNEEKPFTNANLTLHELANTLSITSHNLSQIINTQLKQNFFDFINHYRIEEVKEALVDPEKQHYTLLAIALEAGFNSKSSFNSVFKKHTKMTPFEYKQMIIQESPH